MKLFAAAQLLQQAGLLSSACTISARIPPSYLKIVFYCVLTSIGVISNIPILNAAVSNSVAFEKRYVRGASVYIVTADLNDQRVKVKIGLADKGLAHSESFARIINRRMPLAAVTGTYFDTRSLLPVGTLISEGKMIFNGSIGSAVSFLGGNRVKFASLRAGEKCDWSGTVCGIRTGPKLLTCGYYALSPRREGFKHPGLFGCRTRMALGLTSHNKLLLVAVRTPVTFGKLAGIMKSMGAVEAVCLDGGTSSAMYCNGKFLCKPGRQLTNIIEIHLNKAPDAIANQAATYKPQKLSIVIPAVNISLRGPEILADNNRSSDDSYSSVTFKQYAVHGKRNYLGFSQSRSAFLPVDRAKLTCLQRLKNAQNLVNIAADVKVLHHLIA